MTIKALRTFSTIRNFLFRVVNKEFLVFLFFLVLSGIFWLRVINNQTFEREFLVELKIVNVPRNVVITNDVPSHVRFTIKDKGYMIGGYIYGKEFKPVVIDFATYSNGKGHGSIPQSDIQKQIKQQLYTSSFIGTVKPDKVEFYYNLGRHKKVPIRMLGGVSPEKGYYLSHISFSPDSITVYAPLNLLDSIHVVYTERVRITNFRDTLTQNVALRTIKGAKLVPTDITVKLFPDILTEETVEVPVHAVNMPADKMLRTFPSKVKVAFAVGANRLKLMPKNRDTKQLLPTGFRVVADYNSLKDNQSDKCHLILASTPSGVRNARLMVSEVDYLLESR